MRKCFRPGNGQTGIFDLESKLVFDRTRSETNFRLRIGDSSFGFLRGPDGGRTEGRAFRLLGGIPFPFPVSLCLRENTDVSRTSIKNLYY